MTDFSTDNMVVRATERYAYGWVDKRAFEPSCESDLPRYWGPLLGRTDAVARGYDMVLWDTDHKSDAVHYLSGGRLA